MANLPWLDEVLGRLAKRALPPAYIRRFMEELSDHLEDITEETMSTEANVLSRLGEPNQVAEAAIVAYRRRSFLGRHPMVAFLVFAVSPVVSFVVLFVLAYCCLAGFWMFCDTVCGRFGFNTESFATPGPVGYSIWSWMGTLWLVALPAGLLSILYCKLAARLGIGKKWICVCSAALAAIAIMPYWSARFSGIPGHSVYIFGLWIPVLFGWIPNIQQLCQFIVPLAIGWWFMRRTRDQGRLQLAS